MIRLLTNEHGATLAFVGYFEGTIVLDVFLGRFVRFFISAFFLQSIHHFFWKFLPVHVILNEFVWFHKRLWGEYKPDRKIFLDIETEEKFSSS